MLLKEDQPGNYAPDVFPVNKFDEDGQQVDLRSKNSWVSRIGDVSLEEMCEVQAINNIAPFILTKQVLPLMYKKPLERSAYVINVSAMEGQFNRFKTSFHPHTNCAKAALNMFTRTCAGEFANQGVWLNSVDTGWVTVETPVKKEGLLAFHPPLDEVDGAARVLDPIFTASVKFGQFLKDFEPVAW